MATDIITALTDSTFDEAVASSIEPLLVDFWAEWCAPCKAISPILDELAPAYSGKVRIAKINIDHNPKTPRAYGVRGIPTLMVFKDGKVQDTHIGLLNKTRLTQMLDKAV